jgi:hypothetical protein
VSYLVLDIETVPDYSVWTPPEPEPKPVKVEKNGSKKKPKIILEPIDPTAPPPEAEPAADVAPITPAAPEPTPVPPPFAHRPIAIGCLFLSDTLEVRNLGCIGVVKYGDNEPEILRRWNDFMTQHSPTVVTWNGRGFDLPVLSLRSFRWGITQPWNNKDFRYRYNEDRNMDLFELFVDYGAINRKGFRLDAIAKLIGLPGKYGIDGSQVAGYYAEGRYQEIERYCLTDVIQTAFILFRFLLLRNRINLNEYHKAASGLLAKCRENALTDPPLADFNNLINEKMLLLNEETKSETPQPKPTE